MSHQLSELAPDQVHIRVVALFQGFDIAKQTLEWCSKAEFTKMEIRYQIVAVGSEGLIRTILILVASVGLREPPGMLTVNGVLINNIGELGFIFS